jgi:hypothetical protein
MTEQKFNELLAEYKMSVVIPVRPDGQGWGQINMPDGTVRDRWRGGQKLRDQADYLIFEAKAILGTAEASPRKASEKPKAAPAKAEASKPAKATKPKLGTPGEELKKVVEGTSKKAAVDAPKAPAAKKADDGLSGQSLRESVKKALAQAAEASFSGGAIKPIEVPKGVDFSKQLSDEAKKKAAERARAAEKRAMKKANAAEQDAERSLASSPDDDDIMDAFSAPVTKPKASPGKASAKPKAPAVGNGPKPAAKSIEDRILEALADGPAGKAELWKRTSISEVTLVRKLGELARAGLVRWTGEEGKTVSGTSYRVYELKAAAKGKGRTKR